MATSHNDTMLFWSVFIFVFFVNIITPYVAAGFSQAYTTHDTDSADNTAPPSFLVLTSLSALNILLIPFWTITMPFLMNLFIMIPIRALGWYLFLRLIRGI